MTVQLNSANADDVVAYLHRHEHKDMLRFITCGSVDDGKSTLIGRLLYDSKMLFEDQLSALAADSSKFGTTGSGELDFALLVDGLQAEREQGITIDVAYRFFTTEKRKFIVADTPGHEQYTRNMATGASTADLAVLLIDARRGVLTQTRRHGFIVKLLGIRQVVLAVNKMDLVDYSQDVFDTIVADFSQFAQQVGLDNVTPIPLSAKAGDNVMTRSETISWYQGPSLLEVLEQAEMGDQYADRPFRLPVQWVNRPHQDFRGFAGTIASGLVRPGDKIVALPSGRTSVVDRIVTMDGDLEQAQAGQAVTLTLADELDISRGDIIAAQSERAEVADQFAAHIVWMDPQALLPGRSYLLRVGSTNVNAQVTELKHKINVNTLEHVAAKHLDLNEVALCNLALDRPIAFDPYVANRHTGAFIIVDRMTNATVGCGMIEHPLRRAQNVHWQHVDVDKDARARIKGQRSCILWFTGLSGSGKSTIANLVEKRLHAMGKHTYLLDGDNVRHGLNKDLGFTAEDRVENIRRIGECAKLFVDAGLIVLTAFISPFTSERQLARELVQDGEFIEIFVDTPLALCESRDVKGLYAKARSGKLPNFTGIDSPYEAPVNPEIIINGAALTAEQAAEQVVAELEKRGLVWSDWFPTL